MLDLETIYSIINIAVYVLAYLISVTLVGYLRGSIVVAMGDYTPKHLGLLSLNPLRHLDPIGMLLLLIPPHVGWGRYWAVNSLYIHPPHRRIKLACAYLAGSIGYFLLAMFAIIVLEFSFGTSILGIAKAFMARGTMVRFDNIVLLSKIYPNHQPIMFVIAFITLVIGHVGMLFGSLYFIFDGLHFGIQIASEKYSKLRDLEPWRLMLVVIICALLFSGLVHAIALSTIINIGLVVGTIFGLA